MPPPREERFATLDIEMKPSAKYDLPPTLKTDLFGGHFRSFRKDATGFLTKLSQLGDVSSFRMGPQQAYFINDPDMIRDLLVVNAHKFIKGRALQRAKNLLGEGLLTSEGEAHLRQRRMIQPAFHRARIAEYAQSMVEYADKMSNSWKDGEIRDIDKEMMHLTLQIVAKTLFSANVDDDADEIGASMTTLVELFNYLLLPFSEWLEKLPLPQSRRFKNAKNTLNSVIYGIIDERRRSGEDTGDLLSMLLTAQDEADGTGMTDEQIRDEALTLFLAGHETTANAMTWTWYLLSQNPDKEAKLYEELDHFLTGGNATVKERASGPGGNATVKERAVSGGNATVKERAVSGGNVTVKERAVSGGNATVKERASESGEHAMQVHTRVSARLPTIDDIPNLTYTESILAESMRLFPPAWAIGRLAIEEHEFGGYKIPARGLVLISPYITHRDPRFWDNADEFIPERWEKLSVKEAGQKNIYFPFGGGIRRCIGESFAWTEGILLLATIARKWKLRMLPEQKISLQPMITLRPKYGMRMQCQDWER